MLKFKTITIEIADIKLDEYQKYWSDIDKLIFKPEVTKEDFQLRNVTHQLMVYENSRGYHLVYGLATYLCALKIEITKARVRVMEIVYAQDVASLILRDLFDNTHKRVIGNDDVYKTMLAETVRYAWKSSVSKDAILLMDSGATTKEKVADTLTIYKHATIFNFAQDKDKKKKRKSSADFVLQARWLGFDSGDIEVTFDPSGRIKLAEYVDNGQPQLLNCKASYGGKYEIYEDTSFNIKKATFRVLKASSYYVFEFGTLLVCANIPETFEKGFARVFETDPWSDISETSVTLHKDCGALTTFIIGEEFRFSKENERCVVSSDSYAKTKSKRYKYVILPIVG
ncbi:MAG: hypothetical protein C0603_10490 [Denitrovibrio sp.]|nr:MAG: hypothetical protein C0603_10490 [Denitrovibrio sp.]